MYIDSAEGTETHLATILTDNIKNILKQEVAFLTLFHNFDFSSLTNWVILERNILLPGAAINSLLPV